MCSSIHLFQPQFFLATIILSFFLAPPNSLQTKLILGSSISLPCICSLWLGSTLSPHGYCFWKDVSLFISRHLFSVTTQILGVILRKSTTSFLKFFSFLEYYFLMIIYLLFFFQLIFMQHYLDTLF